MSEERPSTALEKRIDHVRRVRKDLPAQLRNIAIELPTPWSRTTLRKLGDALEGNVSSAMIAARFPEHCWLLTLQSSAATTDALTAMLEQSAYQHQVAAKRLRSIAYPLVLLLIAFGLMVAALFFLIPPFDRMYQEFGLRLPAPTLLLIQASRWVTGSPLLVIGGGVVGLIALCLLLATWISDGPLKRKIFGGSVDLPTLRQTLARVALQIAELTDDDVPLVDALKIASQSNRNTVTGNLIADLAAQASVDSRKLNRTRAAAILPPNFLFALQPKTTASDVAGSFPNTTMLRELATSYRELSIRRRDWVSFVFAQVTVIGVGMLIGFAVIALFMPMISLVSALS